MATSDSVGDLYREDLSIESCACLHWYMRNQLYFDLELDQDPRVTIVQYEDAVMKGDETFRRVFDFLGFPYHPDIIKGVSVKSVGKHPLAERY